MEGSSMADAAQNTSHHGYFRVPLDDAVSSGGAASLKDAASPGSSGPVIPARNVTVEDAGGRSSDDAVAIPAERIHVEDPRSKGSARNVPHSSGRNVSHAQKAKGAVQMAGGAVLMAAGVPMCVLPGPGVACIAGGAALASKGQRNFSGREATPIEDRLDDAAEKLGALAKEQAINAARAAAEKAPELAGSAARAIAAKAPEVAGRAVEAGAKAAPKVAGAAVRAVPKVAGAATRATKAGVGFVADLRRKNQGRR